MTELTDTINELITAPGGDLAGIEHTLTDGYAYALGLEAESRRTERRIGEVTRALGRGDSTAQLDELATLARHLDTTRDELERLRGLLASLREVAAGVRIAAAESAA